jgi:hypothetical protein
LPGGERVTCPARPFCLNPPVNHERIKLRRIAELR